MASDLNVIALTGRLTRDPELRYTPNGTAVANMRLAWNTRQKDESGEWGDKGNFINVDVWGNQGEAIAQHLSKGRRIAIQGSLHWREWTAQDGTKRQDYSVTAFSVVYLDYKEDASGQQQTGETFGAPGADAPSGADFPAATGTDDDIPF